MPMAQRKLFRYRITFTKTDKCRFMGHLDLQAFFQRAMKRAKLPIAYSEGFNPHQLMSFAQPLSLGYGGLQELLEVEMLNAVCTNEIVTSLNNVMPQGISIISVIESPPGKAAALVDRADYTIDFSDTSIGLKKLEETILNIMSADEVMVIKKGKFLQSDIRPDIYALSVVADGDKIYMKATLAAGSARNLRPSEVVKFILENNGMYDEMKFCNYQREAIILREKP